LQDLVDDLVQVIGLQGFGQVSLAAGAGSFGPEVVGVVSRDNYYRDLGQLGIIAHLPDRRQAVNVRHADVHQD